MQRFPKLLFTVPITVVSGCPETSGGVSDWSFTITGQTDFKPCPNGSVENVSRECSLEGKWKPDNFTDCSSTEFNLLKDVVNAFEYKRPAITAYLLVLKEQKNKQTKKTPNC